MFEFSIDGYAEVLRIEDDEEFPPDFLKWISRDDDITEYIRDDLRHELMKIHCEE